MAEIDSNDQLLKQTSSFAFSQGTIMRSVVPLNEVNQISTRCVLTDYAQVVWRQEYFLKLDDIGVGAAQPLIDDLTTCCLHTASQLQP